MRHTLTLLTLLAACGPAPELEAEAPPAGAGTEAGLGATRLVAERLPEGRLLAVAASAAAQPIRSETEPARVELGLPSELADDLLGAPGAEPEALAAWYAGRSDRDLFETTTRLRARIGQDTDHQLAHECQWLEAELARRGRARAETLTFTPSGTPLARRYATASREDLAFRSWELTHEYDHILGAQKSAEKFITL